MDKSRLLNMISIQYEAQGVQRADAEVFAKEVLKTGKIPDTVYNRMPVEFRDAFRESHPLHPDLTHSVLACIYEERAKQDVKWAEQNHSLARYFLIAAEEDGEAAKEACMLEFCDYLSPEDAEYKEMEKKLLEELVQATAVKVAIIELLLRRRKDVSRGTQSVSPEAGTDLGPDEQWRPPTT